MGPGVCKIVERIKGEIASGTLRPGAVLPNRAVLAAQFSLSTNTVAQAIAHLKREGVLEGVSGQRAYVARQGDKPDAAETVSRMTNTRSWDAVAEQMKQDIMTGAYRPGSLLPTVKELQVRYNSSYQTIRKAIDLLARQNLLETHGKKAAVPPVAAPAGGRNILFVWYSDFATLPAHDHDTTFIRTLEQECFRSSVVLDKLIVSVRKGGVELRHDQESSSLPRAIVDQCAGVVYLVNWFGSVNSTVFDWLAHLDKPVSIVDWLGGWELPRAFAGKDTLQLLSSNVTAAPGFDAGRYLVGLGHQQVAFFSPYGLEWPSVRFKGISEAYSLAGASFRAHLCAQTAASSPEGFRTLSLRKYRPFEEESLPLPSFPEDYEAGTLQVGRSSWIAYENSIYYETLVPLFERALADKKISAWIGCDDEVAMMAWSFLHSRKVKIPDGVSLMGFGNTLEAVVRDVTSYDYDYGASASAILAFLLRPTLARNIRRLVRPEIRGHIIQRGSTAAVKR